MPNVAAPTMALDPRVKPSPQLDTVISDTGHADGDLNLFRIFFYHLFEFNLYCPGPHSAELGNAMNAGTAAQTPMSGDSMDDVERMLVDSARALFRDRQNTARMKLNAAQASAFDAGLWREMADMGWLGLRLPEALGGQNLPLSTAAALAEQFGAAMMPEPFIACGIIPSAVLASNSVTSEARSLGEAISGGSAVTSLAWQEQIGQTDPANITTRLTASGRLQGRKLFVPNADISDFFIVAARTESSFALTKVRTSAPGLKYALHRTGDGTHRAQLIFNDTPIESVLSEGDAARAALAAALEEGTLASAAYQTGLASAALDLVLSHLKTRIQFDRPLGTFQTLQHRTADLYMACQLSRASWRRAAIRWDMQPNSPSARAAISAAKSRASQTALRVARSAVQMFGGLGFAEEADVGLALRIALQYSSWLGSPAQHLQRFATLSELRA
jgi:alkylation response protein AidB-like acyl-CoA dehydrogenase